MRTFSCLFLFFSWTIYSSAQTTSATGNNEQRINTLLQSLPGENPSATTAAMYKLSQLGTAGITEMVQMLSSVTGTKRTALEFAIAGYAVYVSSRGKEALQKSAVQAYCAALETMQEEKDKKFLVSRLQLFGGGEATTCLQKYLQSTPLAGEAARALAQINSTQAQTALVGALKNGQTESKLAIIEALGNMHYKAVIPALIELVRSGNPEEKKVAIYALAQSGNNPAGDLLRSAAAQSRYTYEPSNATARYLAYLKELSKANPTLAVTRATSLMKDAANAGQMQTRIAALKLLVDVNKEKSMPLILAAMKEKDPKYRSAALQFAIPYFKFMTPEWGKTLQTAPPETQAQIIEFISRNQQGKMRATFRNFLSSGSETVRLAAINAFAKEEDPASIPLLLQHMKNGTPRELNAVRNTLLQMKGATVPDRIAAQLKTTEGALRSILLEVLSIRPAASAHDFVFAELNNPDTSVHKALVHLMPSIVTPDDLPGLYRLIRTAPPADIPYYQLAISNAAGQDASRAATILLQQMRSEAPDKQLLYYDILATRRNDEALNALRSAFDGGDEKNRKAVINAFAKSATAAAARHLYQIATNEGSEQENAFNAYLEVVGNLKIPEEQKLLFLEQGMEKAKTNRQKQFIIREAGNCRTFLSLLFVGQYLDDASLQQQAATSVMNIITSNDSLNGDTVRSVLKKTIGALKGGDAEYQKKGVEKYIADMQRGPGWVALFNGKDLTGWKGLVENPIARMKMPADSLSKKQVIADRNMQEGWVVKDGVLVFTGHGENLCTVRQYGDFEMYTDWKITKAGDAGIYLRGSPQVQIWDTARVDVGAQVGSGGLYNNQKNQSKPLLLSDNAIGEWNTFHIIMKSDKVTVFLNGKLVTDEVVMENYWDRSLPIFPKEQIELQAHGTYVAYRNIFIKELNTVPSGKLTAQESTEGFEILFNGDDLDKWIGNKSDYTIRDGNLVIEPQEGSHGNLYTKDEYADFIFRFEFQLTPGANNGLGIRTPAEGDAAYEGMEIQILDNEAPVYKSLQPYQYHGSVYGVIPAKRGFLKNPGEWNTEEVIAKGANIKVTLNGEVILEGNIDEASRNGTADHREHPGLHRKSGHIGFLGHGSVVRFRNIRVKRL